MAETVAKMITQDVTQTAGDVVGLVAGSGKVTDYLMYPAQTVGAVQAELSLDSLNADFLETQDNKTYLLEVKCVGRDVATTDQVWFDLHFAVVRGVGFATCLQKNGGLGLTGNADLALATAVLDLTVDTLTDGHIIIRPTGVAGITMNWVASVRVTEV